MLSAREFALTLIALLVSIVTTNAFSHAFPAKPIRIVTGSVGGNSDFSAGFIAAGVENRGGGILPGLTVVKSPPDGSGSLASRPIERLTFHALGGDVFMQEKERP